MIEKTSRSIKNFYGYGTMWKKTAAQKVRSSLTMKLSAQISLRR